jgi:hypothetical protein
VKAAGKAWCDNTGEDSHFSLPSVEIRDIKTCDELASYSCVLHILAQISNLNSPCEPPEVRRHLYLCGFGRGEDGLEVHTQWVRNKISIFSSLSMLL